MQPVSLSPPRPGPGLVILTVLVGLWTVGATWLCQSGWWVFEQLMVALAGARIYPAAGVAATMFNVLLVAVPAGLLTLVKVRPAVRAAGFAWLTGAGVLLALGFARGVPSAYHEWYLGLAAVLCWGFAGAIRLVRRLRRLDQGLAATRVSAGDGLFLGLISGLLVLLPWPWAGSFGSLAETLLAVLFASGLGALAGTLLGDRFWPAFQGLGNARLFWWGGLTAAVALLLLAAGTGSGGVPLLVMVYLPVLGLVAAVAHRARQQAGRGVTTMVALAALGPLAFLDPDELSLSINLGSRDAGFWALLAVGGSLTVGLLLFLSYGVTLRHRTLGKTLSATLALALLLAGAGVYFGLGRPGFHGDGLVVILKSQAPLGDVKGPAAVYRRLVGHAESTQAPLRTALRKRGLTFTPYYLLNAIEVDASDPVTRGWLTDRPDVDRVLGSPRLRPLPAPGSPSTGDQPPPTAPLWNLTMIGAEQAWAGGARGQGIVIGSSDSGVDGTHPALRDGYRGGGDSWYDPWNGTSAPVDHGGHGTHTVGSAVGRTGTGVAPEAQWIGCVNLDRNAANPAYYLSCMQFMLAPFPHGGDAFRDGNPARAPQILTNSWGCPPQEGCDPRSLEPAVHAFRAAGIFFAAAAGNTGVGGCNTARDVPARYDDAFTVGAVDDQRRVTEFSSRGPVAGKVKPDLVAPGEEILSALPGGGYGRETGTSMATPQLAGVVALMWSANPRLVGDLDRTEAILRSTATPVAGDQAGDLTACGASAANAAGSGLVNAAAAVTAARAAA